MKIAFLGDTHFGARNSNQIIQHWQGRFYNEVFWPSIEKYGITTVIQTGDYFDNRKWINLQTMAFQREVYVNKAKELGVTTHGIIGNHDIPLRNSLDNNSPQQILTEEWMNYYDVTTTLEFDGVNITLVPWMCKENYETVLNVVKQGGDLLVGHFEIEGALMHPGAISRDGLKYSDFKEWNQVISGHYHTQSKQQNVHYIGTPYQLTWNDAYTKHGFWILDTTDNSWEFIENNLRYFNRFVWDDKPDREAENLENSYVKINVKRKTLFEDFERFVDKINFQSPFELKILESFEEYNQENVKDIIHLSSTTELIGEYIEDVATDNNKESIKKLMIEIYDEAMSMDE